jgi:hypothetical protein
MYEHQKQAYFIDVHKKDYKMTNKSVSVVVQQFLAIVRAEVPVHVPANEFVTVAVEDDQRYCLRCCGVRTFDLWHGRHEGREFRLGHCRCCGAEVTL